MKSIALIFLFSIVSGCNYNRLKETGGTPINMEAVDSSAFDYAMIEKNVIGPRCLNCHNGGQRQGGISLEGYSRVKALLPRIIDRSLERRDMPPRAPLNSTETQALQRWLDLGAPEIVAADATPVDPNLEKGPTDFTKIRDRIFLKKCLDCHSGGNPQGGLDLSSYQETKRQSTALFDRLFVKGDMPIDPYPSLSPRERKTILKWFDLGMPR